MKKYWLENLKRIFYRFYIKIANSLNSPTFINLTGFSSFIIALITLQLTCNDTKQDNQINELRKITESVDAQLKLLQSDSIRRYEEDSLRFFEAYQSIMDIIHYNFFHLPSNEVRKEESYRIFIKDHLSKILSILNEQYNNRFMDKHRSIRLMHQYVKSFFRGAYFNLTIYGRQNSMKDESIRISDMLFATISIFSTILQPQCELEDEMCWKEQYIKKFENLMNPNNG